MLKKLTVAMSLVALAAITAAAQDKPADATRNVDGTWDVNLMSHQVALVLAQRGTQVTGTFTAMNKEIEVSGEFVDNKLSLTGKGALMSAPHDGSGPAPEPVPMKLNATLLEDGTLDGEMPSPRGAVKWTAERLKKRK